MATNIGTSKTQSLMNLKSDLRGWRLNGVEPLKPVDPLFSEGISKPSHETSASFLGQNSSQSRDEVFEKETYRYLDGTNIVPSWFKNTKENPDLDKSKLKTQRDTDTVQFPTELYPDGEYDVREYVKGEEWETGSKRFQQESPTPMATVHAKYVGLSKHIRYKVDPEKGPANVFYGKPNEFKGDFNFPGGDTFAGLEYNQSLVNEELGLIPFCITTITPDYRTYINFPAHLENYEDNYTGNWDSVQYVGRAENFYGYTGFVRDISLSFKVVAPNPQTLADLYSRLNRLVGGTAPSYTPDGLFMRGTLASLTIGDLLRNQTGFIKSVRLSLEQDVPWEIGPVSSRNPDIAQDIEDMYSIAKVNVQDGWGEAYYRVPHMLNVSLGFTPIEHGTVREDYNAYFVFDPKELKPTVTGTPEYKGDTKQKKEISESSSFYFPANSADDMIRDINGMPIRMRTDADRLIPSASTGRGFSLIAH